MQILFKCEKCGEQIDSLYQKVVWLSDSEQYHNYCYQFSKNNEVSK